MAETPSSPPTAAATPEESLAWYKKQYEQLADELTEFRESSHELEAELEKDLDAADKRQRDLEQRSESLQFEVDEWKEKCKKAKAEANSAQNALEKEITTLRDANRSMQLRLRDIEVANDDFERQARNTTSSLEDMESKYNVAIERTVMMEEEIKIGEQERESLRIESQRLREELSDLKVEAEIMQDKIKKAENRHLSTISTDISIPDSPSFENSPRSTASSPMISTPPNEVALLSTGKAAPEIHEPPSPPMSDASLPIPRQSSNLRTPAPSSQKKSRIPSADHSITPKPRSAASSGIRPPGMRSATTARTAAPARTVTNRASSHKLPASASLSHVRTLTAQMQKLEARVASARSKLPAPVHTPPRASPRSSVNGTSQVPSTVTMRSRKRNAGSTATPSVADDTPTQATTTTGGGKHVLRLSTSSVSRLSFGPLPNRNPNYDPDGSSVSISRPSSRASISSFVKPDRPASRSEIGRPASRTSLTGARTPMGVRPRSSIGGLHGHSQSVTHIEAEEFEERTPSRRGTYSKYDAEGTGSNIPAPSGFTRRQSGSMNPSRRVSGGVNENGRARKLSDLGETY